MIRLVPPSPLFLLPGPWIQRHPHGIPWDWNGNRGNPSPSNLANSLTFW